MAGPGMVHALTPFAVKHYGWKEVGLYMYLSSLVNNFIFSPSPRVEQKNIRTTSSN